jgi:putative hydrolase of the HAD superfamily
LPAGECARYGLEEGQSGMLIVFDGDDTLWKTQALYDAAKRSFAARMRSLGIQRPDVIDLLDEIDARRVEQLGFTVERFLGSMIEAYERLCRETGQLPSAEVVADLRRRIPELLAATEVYEDAVEALNRLAPHYRLALLTKGEERVQARRIAESGLAGYFDRTYIVPQKTEAEYRQVLHDFAVAPRDAWAIGNSARSDINPALRVGMRAVLIPRGRWRYEVEDLVPGDVVTVASLSEAAAAILQREAHEGQERLRQAAV